MPDECDVIRAHRLPPEEHRCLVRRPVAFPVVALHACTDEVLPRVLSPAREREHVVYRQGEVGPAAVLAAVPVTPEDILSGENDLLEGNPDVHREADNTRKRHARGDGPDPVSRVRLDKLGLSQVQEDDRLLCVDDAHGLIALIEDQNFGIQPPGGTLCVDLRAEVSLTSLLSGKMNGSPLEHREENIPHVGYIVKRRARCSVAGPKMEPPRTGGRGSVLRGTRRALFLNLQCHERCPPLGPQPQQDGVAGFAAVDDFFQIGG